MKKYKHTSNLFLAFADRSGDLKMYKINNICNFEFVYERGDKEKDKIYKTHKIHKYMK